MATRFLNHSARFWFVVAAVGQLAFVGFILGFYGLRTFKGDWPAWNQKPLIMGYVQGDGLGNLMFALHVLLAAVVILGGLTQLLPMIRRYRPAVHRWNGRVFIVIAMFLALGGLWMTWLRGARLSNTSLLPELIVSLNALIILLCCSLAIYYARQRLFDLHRRWALRAFLAVAGVWFFRVAIMAWIIINQGPRGMNDTLSGPADIALAFCSYIIPLVLLELYFAAQGSQSTRFKIVTALIIVLLTLLMGLGIGGTIFLMWLPYL